MRRVQVYRNLHKSSKAGGAVYSVRDKKTRLVFNHQSFLLLQDCKFHVSDKGRARVLREKKKNVHAWIEGNVNLVGADARVAYEAFISNGSIITLEGVLYNPYRYDKFQRALGGPAPEGCSVIFTPHSVSIITSSIK